uniref:non-specific serine/threonine protein kinase n=1 Tax=Arundo donax TaxID=35708 RepID=A0A0A9CNV1_ARUDO
MNSLQNLEALDLSESYLDELPTFVGSYRKLTYLNLRGCDRLQNLPTTLGDLKRLHYLNISHCSGVSKILESLCGLHELRLLDLSSCPELQQFPHLFGNLTNLEDLNLSGCSSLKKLPESFGHLYCLRFLNLSGCSKLQQLPEYIIGLVNLQYLNLAHNLFELPEFLSKLERLHTLDITGYHLSLSSDTLPTFSGIVQRMPNLKLLLTDDSDVEVYLSQHIRCSTEIRNLVREGKAVHSAERENLSQMRNSPYPQTLQEENVREKNREVMHDQHVVDDPINTSEELTEEQVLDQCNASSHPESSTAMRCLPSSHGEIFEEDPAVKSVSVQSLIETQTAETQYDDLSASDFNYINAFNMSAESIRRTQCPSLTDRPSKIRVFSFSELKNATRNFSRSLMVGEGGRGCVYRGIIKTSDEPCERIEIAVKKLNRIGPQEQEFLTEMNVLGIVEHPNLIKLIGYCAEERGVRLLVYEYMPNGSVDDHLLSRSTSTLSWPFRLKVALDSARGLKYLHEEMDFQVIFRDLKPSNILLDENWNAKLSDFGLACHGPAEGQTHVSTEVVGTLGYAAPEYLQTGWLTAKSDIWSYGVLLYVLITGRRPVDQNRPKSEQNLVEWVKPYISNVKRFSIIIDPRLEGHYNLKSMTKLASVANCCLVQMPKSRPKMSDVYEMVQKIVDSLQTGMPQPPLHHHGLISEPGAKRTKKGKLKRKIISRMVGLSWKPKITKTF